MYTERHKYTSEDNKKAWALYCKGVHFSADILFKLRTYQVDIRKILLGY